MLTVQECIGTLECLANSNKVMITLDTSISKGSINGFFQRPMGQAMERDPKLQADKTVDSDTRSSRQASHLTRLR